MKIAVEGCCHGELDNIYKMVDVLEQKHNMKVDLLLICGDFQSVRNTADLECMAVPPKYRAMGTFYKYYTGEKVAPVLTVFVGGNHEASNYLQELPYGGWVAPKIYYMGYANVLQFGGVRIGGLSGIYKPKHYAKGHYERPPYAEDTKRSAYHIRNVDVFRLKQLQEHVDIFLSHDWPLGIYKYGNVKKLLARKKFLQQEVESNTLGSKPGAELLHLLQPSYWFSAHLHTKFAAMVKHSARNDGKVTKFLSLDKCLPQRQFLQVLDIPHDSSKPLKLQLDAEWLAILKSTNHLLNLSVAPSYLGGEKETYTANKEQKNAVIQDFGGNLTIPENFQQTVPAFDASKSKKENMMPPPKIEINPQTTLLCSMLDLTDPNAVFLGKDSSFQLPSDADLNISETGNSDDDNDEVDDDDVDSEQSFVSFSESEQSFSDRSLSFLSMGNDSVVSANDSIVSVGNIDESVENEGKPSSVTKLQTSGSFPDKLENLGSPGMPQKLGLGSKRLSLSERLQGVKTVNSGSELNTSELAKDGDDEDDELASIISAQKLEKQKSEGHKGMADLPKSEADLEIIDAKNNSSSDIGCRSLEITDDDDELREMLAAQKSFNSSQSSGNASELRHKDTEVLSVENDDLEYQEIIASQKKNQSIEEVCNDSELQQDFEINRPSIQSSPLVTISTKLQEAGMSGDIPAKRSDDGKSPMAKKFKRRNLSLYEGDSVE